MAGTATGRTANAGSLTIPFSPVALVGTDTVRTLNAGTLKVTKPLIGESMLPISVVQFAGGFNAGLHSSFLVVFATNPVPGNLILTLVEWKTTGSPTVTASGGATNIWTQIGPTFDGSGGESQAVFACIAKPTGMTMFINFSAPVTDIAMDIAEYRNTSNVIDDISNGSSLTGSIDTGIISTTFANDLLIAFQKANSAVTVTSPGWTTRGTGGANFFGFAERIPRVLGTYNYTGTATTPWTASIYGIKGNAYGVAKANNAGALTSSRPLSGTCTVRGVNTGDLFVTRILAGTATVRGINLGTLTVVFNVNALAGICTVRGTNTGALRATKLLTGVCTARGINTGSLNVSRFAGACTVRGVNTGIMRASKPLAGACTGRGSNTGVLRATKAVAGTSTVLGINTGSLFVGGVALFVSGTCTVRTANTGKLLIQKPLTGLCTVRGVNVGAINSLKILSGIDTVRANSFGNLSMLSRFRGTATVRAQNTGVLRSNKRLTGICTVRTVSGGELDARRGPTYTMHFSIKVNNYKGKLHLLS
jgi:hypothetical protein